MSAETVLFDAPGPKARRRHAILTVVGVLWRAGALWVVVRKMGSANQLEGYMWSPFVTDPEVWTEYLLPGLWATLKAAILSVLAGRLRDRLRHGPAVAAAGGPLGLRRGRRVLPLRARAAHDDLLLLRLVLPVGLDAERPRTARRGGARPDAVQRVRHRRARALRGLLAPQGPGRGGLSIGLSPGRRSARSSCRRR